MVVRTWGLLYVEKETTTMIEYSKREWLLIIDTHVSEQTEVKVTTATGKPVVLKASTSFGFIAYHLSQKYADWTTGEGIYCSQIKLAKDFNMSNKTVGQVFQLLEELGLMTHDSSKDKQDGRKYYDLAMPTLCSDDIGGMSSQHTPYVLTTQEVCSDNTQTTKELLMIKEENKEVSPAKPGGIVISMNLLDSKGKEMFGASRRATSVPPTYSLTDTYILDSNGVLKVPAKKEGVCSENIGSVSEINGVSSENLPGSEGYYADIRTKIRSRLKEESAKSRISDSRIVNAMSVAMTSVRDGAFTGTADEIAEQALVRTGLVEPSGFDW
ncbi:hypothetical protein F4560_004436 [Saccharothrix ecbatanensis]|uniref:Uncharacterized protein n=1 Tax=Saccharothrix ecbatanensis TaxID=1105145 RepID=A0A7W9HMK5_9PSEU|nr:hypothetical protein [Saccharothrix ecbatanensis]MBB5804668.1 hypothetical protein [Saccharothrix ecbatanensis]